MKLIKLLIGIFLIAVACYVLIAGIPLDSIPKTHADTSDKIMWVIMMTGLATVYIWAGILLITAIKRKIDLDVVIGRPSVLSLTLVVALLCMFSGLGYFIFTQHS